MAAGTEIERLIVRLVGDATSYQKTLRDAQKEAKRTGQVVETQSKKIERIGKSLQKFGASVSRLGRSLSLKLTAPLTIIGGLSVRAFAQFDNAMTQSTSIMKVTTAQMKEMRDVALSLSGVAAQAPKELAESYFFLASAGKSAEQAMALLPRVAEFATAGAFDMALATDLLTDAQSALGLATKDVTKDTENLIKVSDVLVKANTLANASVQQFSIALTSKAGAALKSYNVDVEEGVAVLAALADQGIKAQLAGNALDRVIRLLSKASRDNTKDFEKFGFSVFNVDGSMRNLADIIGNIEDITKDMSVETKSATLEMLGFEARVQGVILPLLGTSDAIRKYEKELRNAQGITKEVADKQMKSFSNQMKLLKNQITIVGIEIGETLVPVIKGLSRLIKSAMSIWRNFNGITKSVIVTLGLLIAVIGPLLIAFGSVISLAGFTTMGFVALGGQAVVLKIAVIGLKGAFVGLIGLGVVAFFSEVRRSIAEANKELDKSRQKLSELEESSRQRIERIKNPERRAESARATSARLLANVRADQFALTKVLQEQKEALGNFGMTEEEGRKAFLLPDFFEQFDLSIPLRKNLEDSREELRKHDKWLGQQGIKVQERELNTLGKTLKKTILARFAAADKIFAIEKKLVGLQAAGPEKEPMLIGAARSLLGFFGKPGAERSIEEARHAKQIARAEKEIEVAITQFRATNRRVEGVRKEIALDEEQRKTAEERTKAEERTTQKIVSFFDMKNEAVKSWSRTFVAATKSVIKAEATQERAMKEGVQVTERFLTPQIKFLNRLRDLQGLLNVGALGKGPEAQGIFDRAVKEAQKEFDNAINARGKQVTEQFLTPQEKFAKRQKNLQKLLGEKQISQPTFERAMKSARIERDKTLGGPRLGRVTGARFGSLEAQQRVAEFKSLRGGGEKAGVAKTNELLTEIRDNLVDLPTPIEVEEAGLTV